MKIRNGYVSNSSSSSFIIARDDCLNSITEENLTEAIKNIFIDYDETVKKSIEYYRSYDMDIDDNMINIIPFHVYDLFSSESRKKAFDEYGGILNGWISNMSRRKGDNGIEIMNMSDDMDDWDEFCDSMEFRDDEGYFLYSSGLSTPSCMDYSEKKGMSLYDAENGEYRYKPAPAEIIEKCRKKWNDYGFFTNDELLMNPMSRFFIHFNDNEIFSIRGFSDDNNNATCADSPERFTELVVNELKRMGVLPHDYKWTNVFNCVSSFCMHEG